MTKKATMRKLGRPYEFNCPKCNGEAPKKRTPPVAQVSSWTSIKVPCLDVPPEDVR